MVELLKKAQSGQWGQNAAGFVESVGGVVLKHGNVTYIFNPQAPSLGSRAIALASELSDEEKSFYIERGALLHESIKDAALVNGFDFDIPDGWSGSKYSTSQTYFPETDQNQRYVSADLISAPKQKAYISASLIEMLLALLDKIGISGGFGTHRAVINDDATNQAGLNVSDLDSTGGSITDHAFGRGIDIDHIGTSQESIQKISQNKAEYMIQLEVLLEALNVLPMPLLPDLIVIHPEVALDLRSWRRFRINGHFSKNEISKFKIC